jgi:hypothetical protein
MIFYRTVFCPSGRDSNSILLDDKARVIRKQDFLNGYLGKERFITSHSDKVAAGQITYNSRVVEYRWTKHRFDVTMCENLCIPIR